MKNIADLQLRFAYDQFIARYPETENEPAVNIPIPNQWVAINDSPNLIPEGTFFHRNRTEEDIYRALGRDFPIEDVDPRKLVYSHIFFELGYYPHNAHYKLPQNGTVDEYIAEGLSFTYPIYVWNSAFWESNPWHLSPNLQDYIKTGQVKVVLILEAEGDGFRERDADWMNTFADMNGLGPDTFTYYTNNFIYDKFYSEYIESNNLERKVSILCHNEFEISPWFIERDWSNPHDRWDQNERIERYLHYNRSNTYEKYFLCYQRRPRLGRVLLYGLIKANPLLEDKTTISLGALEQGDNPEHLINLQKHSIREANKLNEATSKYLEGIDILQQRSISEDLSYNLASNFVEHEHTSHFLSIVSETHTDSGTLFFSEKMWKPIYACQPFILFGNPYSLKKLRELGYKTFGEFWDESYDEIEDLYERLLAIEKVLEEIASWSPEKLRDTRFQMHSILEHNINMLKNRDRYYEYLFSLQPPVVNG